MKKRLFCMVLCLLMVYSVLPVMATAPMVVLSFPSETLYIDNGYTVSAKVVGGSGSYSYRWQGAAYRETNIEWIDLRENMTYNGTRTDTFTFTTWEGQIAYYDKTCYRCVVRDKNGTEYASSEFFVPTPLPKQEQDVILFYGLEKASFGNVPDYTAQSPCEYIYRAGEIRWYRTYTDNASNLMKENETFTAGSYCVRVYILTGLGYKVSDDPTVGLFNGEDRFYTDIYGDPYVIGFCDVVEPQNANIQQDPVSVTVPRGQTATLQVKAQRVKSYMWQCLNDKYWIDLTPELAVSLHCGGTTTDTFTWVNGNYTRGVFRCKLTGNDNNVCYTAPASITFGGNPIIKEQPEVVPFWGDGTAVLTVEGENFADATFSFIEGNHVYTLEELKNVFPGIQYAKTVSADGATAQLRLSQIPSAFSGVSCTCVVTNGIGKATGGLTKFSRYPDAPKILKQPEDRYVCPGQSNKTLRVNASGSELKFEWQVLVEDTWYSLSAWKEYFTGANTDTLRITPALAVDPKILEPYPPIRCVVSNRSGSVKTETVRIFASKAQTPCTGGYGCPGKTFRDMPSVGDWSHGGIDFCLTNGLFSGVSATSFAPVGTMTRSMLVSVLWRLEGKPESTGSVHFDDVGSSTWYSDAVAWAAENGIVSGVGGNRFNPEGNVTREQIAVIFFNYTGYKGYRTGAWQDKSEFGDADKVNDYADAGMSWAIAEGLISGIPSGDGLILNPLGNASRAQVASIIQRFCQSFLDY